MAINVPREDIRTLVATLSGIPVSRVYWAGEAEKMAGPISGKAGKITLNVVARAINGTEEPRRTYNAGTGKLDVEYGAHRTLTISMRADNFLGHGQAFDTIEAVRFRMARAASRSALLAADLAFVDAPSVVSLDYKVDTREVSAASLDVRFAQVVNETDTAGAEDWIEKVSTAAAPADLDDVAAAEFVDLTFTPVP